VTHQDSRGARAPRQSGAAQTLARVRTILEETCEQDGQGSNLQETARRKAYRAGINRALAEIAAARPRERAVN
jgi:hypothetical protein